MPPAPWRGPWETQLRGSSLSCRPPRSRKTKLGPRFRAQRVLPTPASHRLPKSPPGPGGARAALPKGSDPRSLVPPPRRALRRLARSAPELCSPLCLPSEPLWLRGSPGGDPPSTSGSGDAQSRRPLQPKTQVAWQQGQPRSLRAGMPLLRQARGRG